MRRRRRRRRRGRRPEEEEEERPEQEEEGHFSPGSLARRAMRALVAARRAERSGARVGPPLPRSPHICI